ncbi:hypothetical protein [Dapis sp. BLCC M172]
MTGRDPKFMVQMVEVKSLQGWFIRRLGGFPINPKNPFLFSSWSGINVK